MLNNWRNKSYFPIKMKQNQEPKSADDSQIFAQTFNIKVNGQNFSQLDNLPPEIKEKVEAAFIKLQGNPNLMNMIKGIYDISKNSHPTVQVIKNNAESQTNNQNALKEVLSTSINSTNAEFNSPTVSYASSQDRRNNFNAQSKFNSQISPVSNSGNSIRNLFFAIAVLAIVAYLIAKFVFKMQF